MDDNTENKPEEKSEELIKDSAEEWNKIPPAAESIENKAEEIVDDFAKASAEEWSKVPPGEPVPPVPPTETDRWGAPVPPATDDPNRWSGELYTPESEPSEPVADSSDTTAETPETPVVVDYVSSSGTVPPAPAAVIKDKSKFPVWAIILIVVLVICICVACPILLILSGLVEWFRTSSLILPMLIFV